MSMFKQSGTTLNKNCPLLPQSHYLSISPLLLVEALEPFHTPRQNVDLMVVIQVLCKQQELLCIHEYCSAGISRRSCCSSIFSKRRLLKIPLPFFVIISEPSRQDKRKMSHLQLRTKQALLCTWFSCKTLSRRFNLSASPLVPQVRGI